MYVNTLITLQENLSTYGIDGKKVTGHVTITSPGLIKCYIQNLKKQSTGQTYALYAFSKAKEKGVRVGNLGNEKETKWIIDGKNIQNSYMELEELDGVAIVVEDDMRGVDTILMGFKNNRYMIIPLIDDIFKKRIRPGKPAHKPEYPEKAVYKSEKPESPPPKNETKIGMMIEPESLIEGPGPVIIPKPGMPNQGGPGPAIPPKPGMPNQGGPGPAIPPKPGMPNQGGPGPVTPPKPGMPNQGGPGPAIPPKPGMPNQGGPGPVIIHQSGMPDQGGPGPAIIHQSGMPNQSGLGPVIIHQSGMPNQGGAGPVMPPWEPGPAIIPQSGIPNQGCPGDCTGTIIPPGDSGPVIIPQPGMPNQGCPGGCSGSAIHPGGADSSIIPKTGVIKQEERIEEVEFELLKIAERLKQIGKQPSEEQGTNSAESSVVTITPETNQDRETTKNDKNVQDDVSRELQRIINMLKENQEIKQKTKGIEQQIERMRQLPQSHKLVQKSDLEKTLESRYMAQQLTEVEQDYEEDEVDTSPKNALNFMSFAKQETITEKELGMQEHHEIESLEKKDNMDGQDEIDYINEIDKKIREIEARRKQKERNQ